MSNTILTREVVAGILERVAETLHIEAPEQWGEANALYELAVEAGAVVMGHKDSGTLVLPNGVAVHGDAAAITALQTLLFPAPLTGNEAAALARRIEAAGFRFDSMGRITGTVQNARLLLGTTSAAEITP